MSLLFNSEDIKFINITFVAIDAIDLNNQIFSYPIGTDFTLYNKCYMYYANQVVTISSFNLIILDSTTLQITLPDFNSSTSSTIRLMLSDSQFKLNFRDTTGSIGTAYQYDSITVANDSSNTYLKQICVTSENLIYNLLLTYPFTIYPKRYNNGTINVSFNPRPIISSLIDDNNLIAFINNQYAGHIGLTGNVTEPITSSTDSLVEVILLGTLEFSLTSNGPWLKLLFITQLNYNESITIYVRCGVPSDSYVLALNTIKVLATEEI
jgi:hypothetical protein